MKKSKIYLKIIYEKTFDLISNSTEIPIYEIIKGQVRSEILLDSYSSTLRSVDRFISPINDIILNKLHFNKF